MFTEQRDLQNNLTGFTKGGLTIPIDIKNRHYQEVLKFIAEGNTPAPDPTLAGRQAEEAKEVAFGLKRKAEIIAIGNRTALLAEVDAMTSVQDVKEVVRKLAEIAYSAVVRTIE